MNVMHEKGSIVVGEPKFMFAKNRNKMKKKNFFYCKWQNITFLIPHRKFLMKTIKSSLSPPLFLCGFV